MSKNSTDYMMDLTNWPEKDYFASSVSSDDINDKISEDTVKEFAFLCNAILIPVVCLFGIISNCIGICVIWGDIRGKTMSTYLYIFGLMIFDIAFLAGGLAKVAPWLVFPFNTELSQSMRAQMKLGTLFADMTFTLSARTVVCVLSLERFLSLIRPPYVMKHIWITKHPIRIILTCFMCTLVFLLPIPLNSDVVMLEQSDNRTEYVLQYKDHENVMRIYLKIEVVIEEALPVLYLILISMVIPWKFFYTDNKQNMYSRMLACKNRTVTLVVMLFLAVYILLTLPSVVVKSLQAVDEDTYHTHGKYGRTICLITDLNNLLLYLNAASDFVVVYVASKWYRARANKMLCGRCRENYSPQKKITDELGTEKVEIFINGERSKLNYSITYPGTLNFENFDEKPDSVYPGVNDEVRPNRFSKFHLSI